MIQEKEFWELDSQIYEYKYKEDELYDEENEVIVSHDDYEDWE